MGRSHYKSQAIFEATVIASAALKCGSGGTETITGFDKMQADDVVTGTLTATYARTQNASVTTQLRIGASGSIKLGSHQYIIFGSYKQMCSFYIERVVENILNCWKLFRAYLTTTYLVTESVNV